MSAALTPRVRMMAICDRVRESRTEVAVFNLKGVRQGITADNFPMVPPSLWLFLILSSPRAGEYPGYIRVIQDRTEKAVFFAYLVRPTFGSEGEIVASTTRIRCSFPEPGMYTVQVWFFQMYGNDVLKGEMPFSVSAEGG